MLLRVIDLININVPQFLFLCSKRQNVIDIKYLSANFVSTLNIKAHYQLSLRCNGVVIPPPSGLCTNRGSAGFVAKVRPFIMHQKKMEEKNNIFL